jgi:signal transduction histidine kinase
VADRWRGAAGEQGKRVAVEPGGAGASCWCAGPDLDRSLDALVENALLYSAPGSEVTIAVRPGRIVVRDRGPGLAAGEEETVFERFNRGSAGRRGPSGTGLGLPIARELSRQWGGDVTLRNREGGGLEATIEVAEARGAAR